MTRHPYQSQHSSATTAKYLVYFTSICSTASLVGLLGTYAILKKPMADELHLHQNFLGLLDSLSFIGRIVGYLFMTFYPTSTPKRDFFINCIFTAIFLVLIPLSSKFPESCQWMLMVAMLCSGFSRAYVLVPNMIMLQYFNVKDSSDRLYINFWAALGTMGDVVAILFTSLLISVEVSWEYCFCLSISVFLICSSVLVLVADEVDMSGNGSKEEGGIGMKQNLKILGRFYREKSNFWWMIEYSLISIMYYNILMWFPYYFGRIGFSFQASLISVMYPTFALLSVGLFQYCLRRLPRCSNYLISIFHGINSCIYLTILGLSTTGSNSAYSYMVLVALSGIVQGGPYSSVTSSEIRLRVRSNREMFLAITTCKLTFQVFTVVIMFLIGVLMSVNIRSFLYILIANTTVTFIIHSFRTARYGQPQSTPGRYRTSSAVQSDLFQIDGVQEKNQESSLELQLLNKQGST